MSAALSGSESGMTGTTLRSFTSTGEEAGGAALRLVGGMDTILTEPLLT